VLEEVWDEMYQLNSLPRYIDKDKDVKVERVTLITDNEMGQTSEPKYFSSTKPFYSVPWKIFRDDGLPIAMAWHHFDTLEEAENFRARFAEDPRAALSEKNKQLQDRYNAALLRC